MDVLHTLSNFLDDLMVVLVIYKTKIDESPAYISLTAALRLANQHTSLFIYDNSPNPQVYTHIENWKVVYRNDPGNPGVSKAYNQGFLLTKAQKKKWLLLVDQDTHFPNEAFKEYEEILKKYKGNLIVPKLLDHKSVVSPLKFYFGGGQPAETQSGQPLNLHDFFFHNSGLLIGVDEFEKAGLYDENLPLDFSDFSFVYRLRQHYDIFFVANFICRHHLATVSISNMAEKQIRFASYLKGARYFRKKHRPSDRLLTPRLFLRAMKLAWRYRSLQFLVLYFRRV